ncbi:MAG: hypothetical protein LUF80_00470 [Oscillospiraceae bacterium]|nr:hypothetical protein [Oscillospiraceae bacterium]
MAEAVTDRARWYEDSDGVWVALRVEGRPRACELAAAVDKPCTVTVKPRRKRRSLDANAYLWVLLDKLAAALSLPKTEIYRSMIREIGGNSATVCAVDAAVDSIREAWGHNGLGWISDTLPSKIEGCTNVVLYYGSSTYDTRQMSRLIDMAVQECKAQGIETMPPEELQSLMEAWR